MKKTNESIDVVSHTHEYLKNKKAITLIALVITIVVLIILAAVAINLSLGDNGIFNKAKYAKEEYLNAKDKEEVDIAKTANNIDEYVDNTRDTKIGTIKKVIIKENEVYLGQYNKYGTYSYDVSAYPRI